MKKTVVFCTSLAAVLFCVSALAQTTKTLSPSPSFGANGDGSIRPGNQPWVDSSNMNQRGIAYDPVTGRLVYVNTQSGSGGSATVQGTIEILDGITGSEISTLNTNGIGGGNYADFAAGVADDGAVYICNHVTVSETVPLTIYRWDSVESIDPPVIAFSGTITPTQRYGSSMDIRGSGAGTQIIIGSMPGTTATNVVIFTTTDGTNFVANVLGTDVATANFNDGIAFGNGNTFWAKRINAPLRLMSFDLATSNAVTLASFTPQTMPNVATLGPIAVDNANQLLAALELKGGNVNGGPERVWLFDISDTNKAPAVLGFRDFVANNQNSTAPLGFLDFGGNQLFAAVTRSGILASMVETIPMPPPIFSQDLFATNRVAIGQTAHFEVQATPSITNYQWYVNDAPISGETNFFLDVPNVQTEDSGKVYSVVVANAAGSTPSVSSYLEVINPADLFHLNLLWRAAQSNNGGSPGPTNWYIGTGTSTPTERTIAFNSLSNQLYVVFRSGNNVRITVVDADSGVSLYNLKTNGIVTGADGGNVPLCAIAVAEDGAIYACNSVLAADVAEFKVYRWENSHPDTLPTLIFTNNPAPDVTSASFRWGDVMDARGSGMTTELVFDAQNDTRYLGVLQPSDETMTNTWIAKGYLLQNVPEGPGGGAGGTGIGRSIQFGPGDTIWQKRFALAGTPLCESGFDPALPGTVAPLISSSTGAPLFDNGAMGISFSLKLGAAINWVNNGTAVGTMPDTLDMYDLTVPATPVLLNRYNFPINAALNQNRIGQVIFTTNYVFALDAGNGVMAFTLAEGPIPAPTFLTQPKSKRIIEGGSATLSVVIDQNATIEWFKDDAVVGEGATYSINNASLSAAGEYWAVGTNANGSATSEVAVVTIELPGNHYSLSPSWSTVPGTVLGTDYVTSNGGNNSPNERSFAYNALSNQLLVVQCPTGGGVIPSIYVLNPETGTILHTLSVEGFVPTVSEVGGSNPINMLSIAVADDGAVYACNGTPNASGGSDGATEKKFRIYRWPHSGPDAQLSIVFEGDPSGLLPGSNLRWGDSLDARGSGVNTELIMDAHNGPQTAVLTPVDAGMTAFTNKFFPVPSNTGSIGRSLQFGNTNSFWQKRWGANLYRSTYDNVTSAQIEAIDFASLTFGGVAVDTTRNLVAGVDYIGNASNPDAVALYDLSDPLTPLLIARYNLPANQPGNANHIGKTIIVGDRIYALDGNAGLAAFDIVPPASSQILLNYSVSGANVNFTWSDTNAVLQGTPSLTPPIVWTDISTVGQTGAVEDASSDNKFYRLKK